MRREVRWERMFLDELEAAFEKCPVVYFYYGLCQPHGPQNAVGLDALKAHAIACRIAHEHGGIVAPPDYWHIHEHGGYAIWANRTIGEVRPWLTAMPAWMHFKNVCYHVRAQDTTVPTGKTSKLCLRFSNRILVCSCTIYPILRRINPALKGAKNISHRRTNQSL